MLRNNLPNMNMAICFMIIDTQDILTMMVSTDSSLSGSLYFLHNLKPLYRALILYTNNALNQLFFFTTP